MNSSSMCSTCSCILFLEAVSGRAADARTAAKPGLELGIVSNFDSRLFNVLRGLSIADLFDTITISSLAHAAKPSPKIFELALEQHAVEPGEAMHVGDSVRDDVEGATKAGLKAVLLARQGKQAPPDVQTIHTLDELMPLVSS